MLAVISPAKTLDYDTPIPAIEETEPRFAAEATSLARSAANLTQKRLRELMHISPALAKLNADRFAGFAGLPERAALFAFAGDVYAGFEVATLDDAGIDYAQDHLRMLSGLYGLLRPLDRIRPYRLEMGTRWAPRRQRLTDWWGDRIARLLDDDVAAEGSGTILNLASQEYWAAVDDRLPAGVRVVAADFREGADARFVSFHAKRARGMLARWVVEHRIDDVAALRGFDSDGYRYDAAASSDNNLRFVR